MIKMTQKDEKEESKMNELTRWFKNEKRKQLVMKKASIKEPEEPSRIHI